VRLGKKKVALVNDLQQMAPWGEALEGTLCATERKVGMLYDKAIQRRRKGRRDEATNCVQNLLGGMRRRSRFSDIVVWRV